MKLPKSIARVAHIAVVLTALPLTALAAEYGTVYTQIGTNGLGIGYAASVAPNWALRGQFNAYKQSFSGSVGDFGTTTNITADLNFNSVPLLADWYPNQTGFRVSGGIVFNNNKITIAGTGATVGTTPNAVIDGEIKMSDSASPYIGVGYATRPKESKGFGFNCDFGAMLQSPTVSLTATSGGVPVSQAEVDAQKAKMQDAVNNLKTMPVIGIGFSYAF
jgi:hypothetical protein